MKLDFCWWFKMLRVSNKFRHFFIFNSSLQIQPWTRNGLQAKGREYLIGMLQKERSFFKKSIIISGCPLQAEPSFKRLINPLINAFGQTAFPPLNRALPNSLRYITITVAYRWDDEDRHVSYNLLHLRPSFSCDFFQLEMNVKQ